MCTYLCRSLDVFKSNLFGGSKKWLTQSHRAGGKCPGVAALRKPLTTHTSSPAQPLDTHSHIIINFVIVRVSTLLRPRAVYWSKKHLQLGCPHSAFFHCLHIFNVTLHHYVHRLRKTGIFFLLEREKWLSWEADVDILIYTLHQLPNQGARYVAQGSIWKKLLCSLGGNQNKSYMPQI